MEASTAKRVIINADDLGFSPAVTQGIFRAHREGVVTSTTIMTNMPAAPDAATRLPDFPDLGVGVHLNASQGEPLSEAGRRRLTGLDGRMRFSATGLIMACVRRPSLVEAVSAEWEAQLHRALDWGIEVTHLDSHRHAHGFPPLFTRVLALAKRYHIPFVRRHREILPGDGWRGVAKADGWGVSWVLTLLGRVNDVVRAGQDPFVTRGTLGVAHTGSISAEWLIRVARRLRRGVTEIMTHPGLAGESADPSRLTVQRQEELEALCDDRVRDEFERQRVERVHYGHLRRSGGR
ncbi:MAG: carbohydrate deacetylase [Phycisphaerae bacterium]